MMRRSLRQRLLALILVPLVLMACVLGTWRYMQAIRTAEDLFDRALLAAALAISRDVAVSGGDALSITTRDLIAEASGGPVLYHVEGPDRAYLTGYAYPPVPPSPLPRVEGKPAYFEVQYRGEPARALRLIEQSETGPFNGLATLTVWQNMDGRHQFARALALRSAVLIVVLVMTTALIIWIGVNRGLRPLLDLEEAIAARSSDDLGRIRRAVPREVEGIVARLNALFEQVRAAIRARDVFISNAAHQLRNPVAGILALAESCETATTEEARRARLAELKASAARTARLTTQMLALERIKGTVFSPADRVDLNEIAREVALRNADRVLSAGVQFDFHPASDPAQVSGDAVLLGEAIENLIDNALAHGGEGLRHIAVSVLADGGEVSIEVRDDGRGLSSADAAEATQRFRQGHASGGSGLGLSIVDEISAMHGGRLVIEDACTGASMVLKFGSGRDGGTS